MVNSASEMKMLAARASLAYLREGDKLGVGSGSTAECLIEVLHEGQKPSRVVSSSERSTALLEKHGFAVSSLQQVGALDIYIDGADEFTERFTLVKGGGGAHTREKILAAASRKFVVIADQSKRVEMLGKFPVAVEVLPLARSLVARKLVPLGAEPQLREGFVTDEGNEIIDCKMLEVIDTAELESKICSLAGVVDCGLFGLRPADVILEGCADGQVVRLERSKLG